METSQGSGTESEEGKLEASRESEGDRGGGLAGGRPRGDSGPCGVRDLGC